MYTEDDKYSKDNDNCERRSKNKITTNYYDENFYKDFSCCEDVFYNKNNSNVKNYNHVNRNKVNRLATFRSHNYSKNKYDVLHLNKKHTIIVISLSLIFIVLISVLARKVYIKTPYVGDNSNYISLQYNQLDMKLGESRKLKLILSDMKSDYRIEWFSSNDNVVTVDNDGNIYATNKGEAIVLVAYYLNNIVYDAQCYVNVS